MVVVGSKLHSADMSERAADIGQRLSTVSVKHLNSLLFRNLPKSIARIAHVGRVDVVDCPDSSAALVQDVLRYP